MAIKIKYDPVGAPLIASYATGVGQANERRRNLATKAMMDMGRQNTAWNIANQRNAAAERRFEAGIEAADARAEAGVAARAGAESVKFGRSLIPKAVDDHLVGTGAGKRMGELIGDLTDIYRGAKVDPDDPATREHIEDIYREIDEIRRANPAPTKEERFEEGIITSPDGTRYWYPEGAEAPKLLETDTSKADAAKEAADEAAEKAAAEAKEYDSKRDKLITGLLPATGVRKTAKDYIAAAAEADKVLKAMGVVDPMEESAPSRGAFGLPGGIPIGATPDPMLSGTASPVSASSASLSPERPTTGLPTSVAQAGEMAAAKRGVAAAKQPPAKTFQGSAQQVYDIFAGVPQANRDKQWAREFAKAMQQNQELLLDPKLAQLRQEALGLLNGN